MATLDEIWDATHKKDVAPAPDLDKLYEESAAGVRERKTGKPATMESLWGYEPGVNYDKGAPFSVRYNYFRANPEEKETYLKNTYGEGNYRQDKGGRYLVRDPSSNEWMPVLPRGVQETAESIGSAALGQAPTIAGGIGGGIAGGLVGGPPGAIIGAGLGAGSGTLADEAAKQLQGMSENINWPRVGGEAALAAGFSAGPAIKEVGKFGLQRGAAPFMRWYGHVNPEDVSVARGFPADVKPPIAAIAPGMGRIEWHRQVRNKLTGDPMAEGRTGFIDQRTGQILEQFGITGPAKDQAMKEITDASVAISGREAGEALAAGAKRAIGPLETEELAARETARRGVQQSLDELNRAARQPVGRLGEDVAGIYQETRRAFTNNMNELYGNIDRLTGNMSLVNTRAVRQEARNLIDVMEPEAVPPIIRRLAADTTNAPMTFREAHELRTTLREMADYSHSLGPIGQRSGNIRQMAREVDASLMNAQGQTGQEAGRLLREADTAYAQGIQRFTNDKINKLISQVREGRAPDPDVVADTLLDSKSMDSVRQMWDVLTPELRSRVRTADLGKMVDEATMIDKVSGQPSIDGVKLLGAIEKRAELGDFVYGQQFMRDLREQARTFAVHDGKMDVSALQDPTMIRQALLNANGAQRSLAAQMEADPAMARLALKGNDPQAIDAAAALFIHPGNEARTLAGRQMTSPEEWGKVQAYALKQLFRGMQTRGKLGREIEGGSLTEQLGKYTPAQQEALFGSPERIENIKLLAREARMAFPPPLEMGTSLAGGQTAGQIQSLPPWHPRSILAQFWGKLADNPTLFDMIAGQTRLDPFKARSIMSYLMQNTAYAGTDVAIKYLGNQNRFGGGRGEIPGMTAPMPGFLGGAASTPKKPVKYGGPI